MPLSIRSIETAGPPRRISSRRGAGDPASALIGWDFYVFEEQPLGVAGARARLRSWRLSAPLLQLLNPLLKALHRESQRLVTEFMGIAEARQSGHGALVLSAHDLKSMPDDIHDGAQ
jgi:hypothetical protein